MKKQTAYISIIAAFVAAGIIGFWTGSVHAKNKMNAARGAYTQAGGFVRNGQSGGFNRNGGGFISGTIIDSSDSSITVKGMDGSSKIILLGNTTAIVKSTAGAKSDLANGTNVVVNGTTNSDGSITATNIQIRSEGMPQPQGAPATR